jgi:dihydrofolate synthase / folylpolyglutamate synthase
MTFAEATAWLNALIDYEKAPDFSYPEAFKLDRVQALMTALNNPERAWKCIHVAGTKGKGTVATYLDALLRAHGRRTGLYTSPHLVSFRERIRIDGKQVDENTFTESMARLIPYANRWQEEHPDERLSFFDVLTAAAFDGFRSAGVEWGVIEVGMGGRLDATNVVVPKVALITPIALEHTKYLGDTIEQVASEKAGIIKAGVPVLIQRQRPEAAAVLRRRCEEVGAQEYLLDDLVTIEDSADDFAITVHECGGSDQARYENLRLVVLGGHQRRNFAAAVAGLHLAEITLDADTVAAVGREMAIPGRLQLHPGAPPILLDVSHTPDSARMLADVVRERFSGRRTTLVFGSARDKRVAEIAEVLAPLAEKVILVGMPGIRSMPVEELQAAWKDVHPNVTPAVDTASALESARDTTPHDGLIVACGSFMLVGAAMEALGIAVGE